MNNGPQLQLDQAEITSLRQQIQAGILSPSDALNAYKATIGYNATATLPTEWQNQLNSALYGGLGEITTVDGQRGQVNPTGDVTQTSTKVVQSDTSAGGPQADTLAVGVTGNPTATSTDPYGSAVTGYFNNQNDADTAQNLTTSTLGSNTPAVPTSSADNSTSLVPMTTNTMSPSSANTSTVPSPALPTTSVSPPIIASPVSPPASSTAATYSNAVTQAQSLLPALPTTASATSPGTPTLPT